MLSFCLYFFSLFLNDSCFKLFYQTAELEEKMKQFGEGSLRKLAMDAPTESIFHFEGEDYKEKRKVGLFIAMSNQGFFFIPSDFFLLFKGCFMLLAYHQVA